jgi:hypothetical protein
MIYFNLNNINNKITVVKIRGPIMNLRARTLIYYRFI